MTQSQSPITRTTHTLPFDKLSARDLKRLCLWLVEREGYEHADHLGAAGSEQGRKIIAWRGGALVDLPVQAGAELWPQEHLFGNRESAGSASLPEAERLADKFLHHVHQRRTSTNK